MVESKPTVWTAVSAVSGLIAAVVIPLAVAFVGNQFTVALKEREIQGRFVELALTILKESPSPENEAMRAWALKVVDAYSGVPMTEEVRNDLSTKLRLPSLGRLTSCGGKRVPSAPVWSRSSGRVPC